MIRTFNNKYQKFMTYLLVHEILLNIINIFNKLKTLLLTHIYESIISIESQLIVSNNVIIMKRSFCIHNEKIFF